MSYTEHPKGRTVGVIRNKDRATIPNDLKNGDWREFQGWLRLGNTPAPYTRPQTDIDLDKKYTDQKNQIQALLAKSVWTPLDLEAGLRILLSDKIDV